jgi:hypothetical protein
MAPCHAAGAPRRRLGGARRSEHLFRRDCNGHPLRRRPRSLGADQIHCGITPLFCAGLSDLVHGEVIGLAKNPTEESVVGLLATSLDSRQRAAVDAALTDMHRPNVNAVAHRSRNHSVDSFAQRP